MTVPGRRSGKGSESIVPYLRDELASKPGELLPAEGYERKPSRSLASRVRRALLNLKGGQSGSK